jgi:hypothetical protein
MPAYRKLMRARYARISEAQRKDERTLVVTGMRSVMESIYFRDLTPDPANGRNRCVAEYFGLASIATDEPNPTQRNPGEP